MNNIFKSITIGNKTLKNRITFAPTTFTSNGLEMYKKIAKGGVSLITLADISVTKSFLRMPTLDTLDYSDYFKSIIESCHTYGCLVSAQLFHPEYDVNYISSLYQQQTLSQEEIRSTLKANTEEYFNNLSSFDIDNIINSFVTAATNADQIGFDILQIHGDRLLGSSTSPIFNKRADKYGDRCELIERVVTAIRNKLPDMPIDFKFVVRVEGDGYFLGRGGVELSEIENFVKKLDNAGVDSFHVTLANHSNIKDIVPAANHKYLHGEGCFLSFAKEVKKFTNKPVCTIGKLQTPSFIDSIILNSDVDYVGISRQIIADSEWVDKVQENRVDDIIYCTYCNAKCIGNLLKHKDIGCILH